MSSNMEKNVDFKNNTKLVFKDDIDEYNPYKPVLFKEKKIVHPDNRKCSELMTKYEYTNVISTRARQIELGAIPYTDVEGIEDNVKKAEKEVRDKKCPLSIIRDINEFLSEKWDVNEMGMPID